MATHKDIFFFHTALPNSVLLFSVESYYLPQASCVQLAGFSSSEVCPTALSCNCTDRTMHMHLSLSLPRSLAVSLGSHRSISKSWRSKCTHSVCLQRQHCMLYTLQILRRQ